MAPIRSPRAFNFDGEFNIANRGIVEFVEVLKLDVAFLYDLLGASQEHKIKPKKSRRPTSMRSLSGTQRGAEYRRLLSNEFMEALRDFAHQDRRTVHTRLSDEVKFYAKDFNQQRVRGRHIAPTLSKSRACGRCSPPGGSEEAQPLAPPEMKLTTGGAPRVHPGHGQGAAEGEQARGDGRHQPRYVQDKVSNALVADIGEGTINPFMF
jgi:serine protein kinase